MMTVNLSDIARACSTCALRFESASVLRVALWGLLVLAPVIAAADVPPLRGPVDDRAGLLPEAAENVLRDDLRALEAKTGHQFALLTLDSLGGRDMGEYAAEIVEVSKLGRTRGRDDGLLLMIVKEGNLVGLHLGGGLQKAISDQTALSQIREDLHPAINRGAAVEGIFIVFQRWMNAAGGVAGAVSPAKGTDATDVTAADSAEVKAAVAQKMAERAARAGALTFQVPALHGAVNDYAGLLSGSERSRLDQELREFRDKVGPQFALLTVPSLDGLSVEDYSIKVIETWKLGRAGVDDGLLLLVGREDRKLRIEVGYGLEGAIPDVVAARIVRDKLQPAFGRGEFALGIGDAFRALMRAVDGQEHDRPVRRAPARTSWEAQHQSQQAASYAVLTLFFSFIGLILLVPLVRFFRGEGAFLGFYLDEQRRLRLAQGRSSASGSESSSSAWDSSSSSWDSSSSSSSSSSDDSGDGGRFGGGGASGSW